jgi:TonB-linked SusC/RagA family outer membrane protein
MKVKYTLLLLAGFIFCCTANGFAQNHSKTVKGTVTDAQTGDPLVGVNILVVGTSSGAATDAKGYYSVTVPSAQDTLRFSFIGYKTKAVPIDGRTTINIQLNPTTISAGNQLVVIGYGTQKKSDLTGAIGVVSVDSVNAGVVTSVNQMIGGKVAGVNIVKNSGKPGGNFSINIRGASSINASNRPLYVIDGVPFGSHGGSINGPRLSGISGPRSQPRSPLASLNPSDIKSIEVLKGPSATAIYGSRGANGVVLITTKEGHSGNVQISYNGYLGVQNPSNQLHLLNAKQYKNTLNAIIDAGGGGGAPKVEGTSNTNWQDEITNHNAIVQNHQLSFSGGTENTTYYLSLNYLNQQGMILNSGFKRYSIRLNLNSEISDKFNIGLRLANSYIKNNFAAQGGGINENAGALYAAYNYDPTVPVRDEDGSYVKPADLTIDNPVALAKGIESYSNNNRMTGSIFGKYNVADHLYLKGTIATDFSDLRRKSFATDITKVGNRNGGIGSFQSRPGSDYLFRGTLHYQNKFGIHQIKAFIGASYQRFVSKNSFEQAGNFPSQVLRSNNLGLGDQTTYQLATSKTGHRLASYIGRINYTLKNTYLLTATIRADGSSRFGVNNRFALFPSVALAWKLKEEKPLKDIKALSSLKLRAAWGESGNQGIGNYLALSTYVPGQVAIWDNTTVTTTTPARIANPNLKWETTKAFNIGLNFGFFENRLTGDINYYHKKTVDMLLNLPVPQSTGFNTKITNIGSMINHGFELTLNTTNIRKKNFTWSTDLNLSTLHNKVKSLGPLSHINVGGGNFYTGNPAIDSVGIALNSFYGYKIIGVWQKGDDFSSTKDNVSPGDLKFKDVNGDGTVNGKDRVILGNSFPSLQGSLGNTFNYKNLRFYISVRGVQGVSMLNLNKVDTFYPVNFRRNKFAKPLLNRWTPRHPSNKYPSFVHPFEQGSKPINNYVVEDASYLKLQEIQLSYTLPHISNRIRSLTIYVTGENLATLTSYDGIDPAINPQGNAGYRIDWNTYPTARTFLLGIKLGL